MDPPSRLDHIASPWLPRLRGDGPVPLHLSPPQLPAPPPTRGWTRDSGRIDAHDPGSPAYAGMDPPMENDVLELKRLPRLRGDGPLQLDKIERDQGAPPPTRGWTLLTARRGVHSGGSPAYAGMDPCSISSRASVWRLPRLRGDGPADDGPEVRDGRAPPPTRGWTRGERLARFVAAGSPAYAGMDPPAILHLGDRKKAPLPIRG